MSSFTLRSRSVHACSRLFTLFYAFSRYFYGGGRGHPFPNSKFRIQNSTLAAQPAPTLNDQHSTRVFGEAKHTKHTRRDHRKHTPRSPQTHARHTEKTTRKHAQNTQKHTKFLF